MQGACFESVRIHIHSKVYPMASKFLTRRGLKQQTIVRYMNTTQRVKEYDELRKWLLRSIEGYPMIYKVIKGTQPVSHCFCSEWYRRDYERGMDGHGRPIYRTIGISASFTSESRGKVLSLKARMVTQGRPVRFYDTEAEFLKVPYSVRRPTFQVAKGNLWQIFSRCFLSF